MNYGDIIKRSWRITWRYKALWVLGIFAGVSGCQASGGGNYGSSGGRQDFSGFTGNAPIRDLDQLASTVLQFIPLVIAIALALILIVIVFSVLGIAARGGLVAGVSAADESRRLGLGELWSAGFRRFWSILGLDILLKLPIVAVVLVMMAGILVPIFGTLAGGGEPSAAIAAPICGSLALGLPVLLVMSFVLGIMYLIALRYVMLGGQGAFEAARNGWRFFRVRFKDTFLLWLINTGLNIVASVALAIPVVVIGIAIAFPLVAAGVGGEWGLFAGVLVIMVFVFWIIAMAYNAVWGTFTSALWTVFFRDVAGMSAPVAEIGPAPAQPISADSWAAAPASPPAPPMAPADAPPMAPQATAGLPAEPPASPAPEPAPPAPPAPPEPPADA